MAEQLQENRRMSPAEYLKTERNSLVVKHEFFDGEVFAMVSAKRNHILINANITGELRSRFKAGKSTCKAVSNDMRVKTAEGYTYPDVVIFCGDAAFEDSELDTLTNPIVIMEILSDSTEAFDRGKKFAWYREIPTLQEYILVSQDDYSVDQYIRKDNGWQYKPYKGMEQILYLESLGCKLPFSEIYWDIVFEGEADKK